MTEMNGDTDIAPSARRLLRLVETKTARVGVIGLGYVGLPLAIACADAGFHTTGFDIDSTKADSLNAGESYIDAVSSGDLVSQIEAGRFRATVEFAEISRCDLILICVPTPLTQYRQPDLSFVVSTSQTVKENMKDGQLVILESTTYPGTTSEIVKPILERNGKTCGQDFLLGYSPEREDPGNQTWDTVSIPKIVSGEDKSSSIVVQKFYSNIFNSVTSVSSTRTAEAVKITENVFRAVNIALVNELKVLFEEMSIDVWEVIDAAATKPFGYMPFYPGPGLGGHCIPIDPFYLTWKSREYGMTTKFIELAGEINLSMPLYVIRKLEEELNQRANIGLKGARILLIGIAYKKNVSDVRESPAFAIIRYLSKRNSILDYHDPHVLEVPNTRNYKEFRGKKSILLSKENIRNYDAVVIIADHDDIDYRLLADSASLIVDTRNIMHRNSIESERIVKA